MVDIVRNEVGQVISRNWTTSGMLLVWYPPSCVVRDTINPRLTMLAKSVSMISMYSPISFYVCTIIIGAWLHEVCHDVARPSASRS